MAGNPEDRFSHNEVQNIFTVCQADNKPCDGYGMECKASGHCGCLEGHIYVDGSCPLGMPIQTRIIYVVHLANSIKHRRLNVYNVYIK